MAAPFSLWALPWWSSPLIATAAVGAAWVGARLSVLRRNRALTRIGAVCAASGVVTGADPIVVGGGRNAIVRGGENLAVIDVRVPRVVQQLPLREISGMKVYDDGLDRIRFRMLAVGGAQSRLVATRSIVDFTRLFGVMTQFAKRIEYIQE